MKRNLILVNLALLATAGLLAWSLLGQWRQFEAEHRLKGPDPGSQEAAAASERPASSPSASAFAAIVDHHLFNQDRSNELPQEYEDQSLQELRPVPVLMGMMGIGGQEVALMVSGGSGSSGGLYRRLQVGQELDGYTLVRIETDRVVMKAGDREVRVGMDRRSGRPRRAARTAPPSATGVGAGRSSAGRRQATARRRSSRPGRRRPQNLMDVPLGTVRDGKRLIEQQTPFGPVRVWHEDKSK